jgi:hypothetical protein
VPISIDEKPALMNTEPNLACSEAIRISEYNANASPPPTAAPLTAAITGIGSS